MGGGEQGPLKVASTTYAICMYLKIIQHCHVLVHCLRVSCAGIHSRSDVEVKGYQRSAALCVNKMICVPLKVVRWV